MPSPTTTACCCHTGVANCIRCQEGYHEYCVRPKQEPIRFTNGIRVSEQDIAHIAEYHSWPQEARYKSTGQEGTTETNGGLSSEGSHSEGGEEMTVSVTSMLAQAYWEMRNMNISKWSPFPVGNKLKEEVKELRDALETYNNAPSVSEHARDVRYEIGDVANCLAWIARTQGVTIEECMIEKAAADKGRGPGRNHELGPTPGGDR
jgi:NTP pyrophosphatase (non-canonical NTP hydrolase)